MKEKALEMSDSVCVLATAMNNCVQLRTGTSKKHPDISLDVKSGSSLVFSAEACLKNAGREDMHV